MRTKGNNIHITGVPVGGKSRILNNGWEPPKPGETFGYPSLWI